MAGYGSSEDKEVKEVKVQSVEYRSDDAMDLARFLITADIRLVRAEFLWSLCEAKGVIPRRQEADQKFFETPSMGKQTALVQHEEVEAWAAGHCEALICSISHCWESREHSDPCGHQLQIISDCTRLYAAAYDAPLWLFLDQVSLFQFKRTEDQDKSFRLGMGHMHLLYCHEYTMTLRVHSISSNQEWEQREKEGRVVDIYDADCDVVRAVPLNKLTRNQNQYLARGWCQAEYEWSSTRAHSAGNQRIDVNPDEPRLKGKVPMLPEKFRKRLDELKFTHRSDSDAVCHLQEKVFLEKVTACKDLKLEFLDEDACESLAESLPYYESLEIFALLKFECSDAVLEKLLSSLKPRLTGNALKALQIEFSKKSEQQEDMILCAVAEVLPQNSSLTSFRVPGRCRGKGVAALAEAMKKNSTLRDVNIMEKWAVPRCIDAAREIQRIVQRNKRNAAWSRTVCARLGGWINDLVQRKKSRTVAPEPPAPRPRRSVWPPVKMEPLLQLLKKNSAVTELVMPWLEPMDKRWGPVEAQALARAIKGNKTVKKIDLSRNRIGDPGTQALAEALKENETVTEIDLNGNEIGDAGAQALAEALKENETVTEISLGLNQIGDAGAQALAEVLKENKTVTEISLGKNLIGVAGAQALAEVLKENKTVTKIDLSDNHIGVAGARALAEALKENKTVIVINLGGNRIGDAGTQALAEALKENSTVTEIYLGVNHTGVAGAKALAEVLRENETVSVIGLNTNEIGPAGAQALAKALKENQTVREIYLWDNKIGDSGARALAEALKENETVTEISLGSNLIDVAGAQALAEVLRENNKVREMDLRSNEIRDAGAQALAEALKENNTVTLINLRGNQIGYAGREALEEAAKENGKVRVDL